MNSQEKESTKHREIVIEKKREYERKTEFARESTREKREYE